MRIAAQTAHTANAACGACGRPCVENSACSIDVATSALAIHAPASPAMRRATSHVPGIERSDRISTTQRPAR
jgi:hypothetical protein